MHKITLLYALCALLFAVICALAYKLYLMKKSAREIRTLLEEKLSSDTNTLITVSTGDSELRALADCLNRELITLRAMKHRFAKGDKEIKDAVINISHDLRTPLTAIRAYLELLEREEKSGTVAEYVGAIRNRTEAMKELTEELFRYSAILAEDQEPALEKVNLTGALEEALSGMYGAFVNRGITPQIHMPEDAVLCIADRKMLLRIIGNILDNALKYSDGDFKVSLDPDGKVQFSNSAKNLSNVDVGRLFDRFYTVDAARKSTGLGLSIAKHLAGQMGADLSAAYANEELVIILQTTKF